MKILKSVKGTISMALSAIMMCSVCCTSVNASWEDGDEPYYTPAVPQSGKCGDNLTYEYNSDLSFTVKGRGLMYDYNQTLYDKPDNNNTPPWIYIYYNPDWDVGSELYDGPMPIPHNMFYTRGFIKSLTVEKGVTYIGENSFYDCGISDLKLPEGLIKIGRAALGCNEMKTVDIPRSVKCIDGSFRGSYGLRRVNIPSNSSLQKIGGSSFSNCRNLSYFNEGNRFPNVKYVGDGAFHKNNITRISLPNAQIYGDAFSYCYKLEKINISSAMSLGESAFRYCYKLKAVKLNKNLKTVGKGAFWNCTDLKSISLPNAYIHENAFWQCSSLEKVNASGTKRIEAGTFRDCSKLTVVKISNNLYSIGKGAFKNCKSLNYFNKNNSFKNIKTIDTQAFLNCKKLGKITFGKKLTSIGIEAMKDCTNLKTVTIQSKNLKKVYRDAFKNTNKRITFRVPKSKLKAYKKLISPKAPKGARFVGI